MARPISFTVLTTIFVAIATSIIVFFISFSHTRKAQVSGIVLPNQGVIKVMTPQTGVVSERRVREGQAVQTGDVLFVVNSERMGDIPAGAETTISGLIQTRRRSLEVERLQLRQQSAQRLEAAERRAFDLSAELKRIEDQRLLQVRRVALAEAAVKRNADLQASNFISDAALQDRRAELLDQQQRLGDLDRIKSATERELSGVHADIRDLTLQAQRNQQSAQRDIAAIEQDLAENEARRQVYVRAPQAGVVTAITAETGQTVTMSQGLATVLPAEAIMSAELYVPSRSAGFIRPGMPVMLRYQAYPFQKFGQHRGRVHEVSSTALRADELPLHASVANTSEPLYRVRVDLDAQTVKAYGQALPLKSGMALDASVLLERRKLYEWVLEPLYSITGRL